LVTESSYYRNVAIWLEKKGYYVGRSEPKKYVEDELFIRRGLKKAQADVTGIRNVGKSLLDNIEIAIIEVKYSENGRQISIQDLEQTRGYQMYAHVCYLAISDTIEITKDREEDARARNIGLLKIPMDFYKKTPDQVQIEDLEVILSPNRNIPSNESEMLEFLDKLNILRCTLCGCYFLNEVGYEENFPSFSPQGQSFKRLARNKVFELFPDKVEYGLKTNHRQNKDKIWKQLCLLCIEDLSKLFGIEEMKKDMASMKKEIEKLSREKT
jgi:hypothetical protein